MDQHREALAANEQQDAKPDWQAEFQENLDSLRNTIDRLHVMRPQYLKLIECAQLNIQGADALAKELNSACIRFGLLPLPRRMIESRTIQRRGSPPPIPQLRNE